MFTKRFRALALVTTLILPLAVGCGDDDDDDFFDDITGDDSALTDGEIAQVAFTANQGEIEQAQTALPRLMSEQARAYAEKMIEEHARSNERLTSQIRRLGIALEDSEVDEELEEDAQDIIDDIEDAATGQVDRVYLQGQVTSHERVLDVIDGRLLQDVRDPTLRSFVQEMRTMVAEHFEEAQRLAQEITTQGTGAGSTGTGSGSGG